MRRIGAALVIASAAVTAVPLASTVEGAPPRAARVVRWVDGDTVETSLGTVRLIGVDTPEVGACGADQATALAQRLAPAGTRIRLSNPKSVVNKDRYGRMLRYLNRGRVDVSLRQIKSGAVARYDSRDGYDYHPRQRSYRAADRRHANYQCEVVQDIDKNTGPEPAAPDLTSYPKIPGTWDCPETAPIKGNRGDDEWIYHMPFNQYYGRTNPEECFASREGAEAAGYRAARI